MAGYRFSTRRKSIDMNNKRFIFLATYLLLFSLSLASYGASDEINREELDKLFELDLIDLSQVRVIVASKKEELVSEAPSIISVVTAKEIDRFGNKNLQELLNRIPSMQGLASHNFSTLVGMRGQLLKHSNNEILFLLNGRPHRSSRNGGTKSSWVMESHITYNDLELATAGVGGSGSEDLLFELTFTGNLLDNLDVLLGGVYEKQDGYVDAQTKYSSNWSSFYGQVNYVLNDTTKLTAGFQCNDTQNVKPDISPRVALVSNFNNRWGAKLLYAEAFRSAYATERFIDSNTIRGNSNLKAETIATSELQFFYYTQTNQVAITFYESHIENVITRVRANDGVFDFVNAGDIKFEGIELEGTINPTKKWYLTGSASYQRNEDCDGIKDITLAPNWMIKLGVDYVSPNGYLLGIFNTYFGEPKQIEEIRPSVMNVNPIPRAYNLVTANLKLDLFKLFGWPQHYQSTFSLYIGNLLDEAIDYPEFNRKNINSIPIHSERAIYASLKVQF